MNTFVLSGKVKESPMLKETSSGTRYAILLLDCPKNLNPDGSVRVDTYAITLWKNLAEENYAVGDYVSVRGRLSANNYQKDSENIYYHGELVAEKINREYLL